MNQNVKIHITNTDSSGLQQENNKYYYMYENKRNDHI